MAKDNRRPGRGGDGIFASIESSKHTVDTSRIKSAPIINITRARKSGDGLLCKRIALGPDGKPISDGSPCWMRAGTATRVEITRGASGLAELIAALDSSEALILGDYAEEDGTISLVTAKEADPGQGLYGRTLKTFSFAREPAVALLDFRSEGHAGERRRASRRGRRL